jgi:hypothetical protein
MKNGTTITQLQVFDEASRAICRMIGVLFLNLRDWKGFGWFARSNVFSGFFDCLEFFVAFPGVAPLTAKYELRLMAFQQLALGNEVIPRWPASVMIIFDYP